MPGFDLGQQVAHTQLHTDHEYQPRELHAKSIEIDGEWAIVGSANLDYLSLFVNHELILVARERRLAESLRLQYERDLEDSR